MDVSAIVLIEKVPGYPGVSGLRAVSLPSRFSVLSSSAISRSSIVELFSAMYLLSACGAHYAAADVLGYPFTAWISKKWDWGGSRGRILRFSAIYPPFALARFADFRYFGPHEHAAAHPE